MSTYNIKMQKNPYQFYRRPVYDNTRSQSIPRRCFCRKCRRFRAGTRPCCTCRTKWLRSTFRCPPACRDCLRGCPRSRCRSPMTSRHRPPPCLLGLSLCPLWSLVYQGWRLWTKIIESHAPMEQLFIILLPRHFSSYNAGTQSSYSQLRPAESAGNTTCTKPCPSPPNTVRVGNRIVGR